MVYSLWLVACSLYMTFFPSTLYLLLNTISHSPDHHTNTMPLGFLPGEPNDTPNSCSFVNWNTIQILAYTSGNNLVILTKNSTHLQTIYLPADSFVVDINKVNGKVAVAIKNKVYVYTPEISNCYNFIFHGRKNLDELKIEWVLEHIITNEKDASDINCLSWSDYSEVSDLEADTQFLDLPPEFNSKTLCELVTGSDVSLTMHQLSYINENNQKSMKCKLVWYKRQPNPIYKVKFSPNAICIASIGKYDKNVKLWHRVGFTTDYCDFELHYILHDSFVTDIIWKNHLNTPDAKNSDSKGSASMSKASSSINLLKPANSIIKNDAKFNLSDSSSVYSALSVENQHNVLYTITSNSLLRVYSTYRLEKGFEIYKSGSLDLFAGEPQKRDHGVIKSVAFIDNPYLELGLEKLLTDLEMESESVKLDDSLRKQNKLLDYIRSKCELCMVIGSDGEVKLYGFGNLCNPLPTNMTIFNIDKLKQNSQTYSVCLHLAKYCLPTVPKSIILQSIQIDHYSDNLALTLVLHDVFKHTIREIGFTFDELFQFDRSRLLKDETKRHPVKHKTIGFLQEKFTGHNKSVRKMIRSTDGSSILSVTRFNENSLWSLINLNNGRTTLTKKSIIITPSPVLNAVISKSGSYVFTFLKNKLICYDCIHTESITGRLAKEAASIERNIELAPECIFILPEDAEDKFHIISIFKNGYCRSYEFEVIKGANGATNKYKLSECTIQNLPEHNQNELHIISPINPVGWKKNINAAGRDVLATVSTTGLVSIYYVGYQPDSSPKIHWYVKDKFRTGIKNASFISGSSINKMAIVDESKSKLSIWDMKVGVMDYTEEFDDDEIVKDLDWTSTQYDQGILAVGFKSYSLLYTQLRYDYTNTTLSFAKIKKVDISDQTTHEIGDSIWMKDGLLVIGAGNQLYLSDKKLDEKDVITSKAIGTLEIISRDIIHLCSALNGPLPLYHPQFIIQLMFSGRYILIKAILSKLCIVLREIDLGKRAEDDFNLGITANTLLKLQEKIADDKIKALGGTGELEEEIEFSSQGADIIIEKLQKMRLPFLSGHQQITLSHTVGIMKDILLKYVKVLDLNGLKFYLTMKLFTVNMAKEMANTNISIRMRDATFALHSDNKDLLYDLVNEQADNRIDWLTAKRYLLPYWLESNKLKNVLEKIAANEFLKFQNENGGKKDPSVCSIFYLTLKKKNVLLGLWKNSIGHSEREKMVKFLSHDFSEKRWKSAALKNAFVLLGKHRYEDAATFFLLADSPVDAVNVIVKQMKDIPLAVAVARCYEGCDNGPSMKSILERGILLHAIETNNRWILSWVFWILGDKPHAAQALIKPLIHVQHDIVQLLPKFKWPNIDTIVRTGNTEDPVLLIMYDSLRNRNVAYYRGIANIKPEYEFSFVIKSATMYSRMGCDWLALYLLDTWRFSTPDESLNIPDDQGIVETEEITQRKKPGDILAKFMSTSSSTNNGTMSNNNNNLLDAYAGGNGSDTSNNLLDSFMSPPPKGPTMAPNLLDNFSMETSPIRKNNLLDDYMGKRDPTPSKSPKQAAKSKAVPPVSNMLDAWS